MNRDVVCADAVEWLKECREPHASFLGSLPDYSEFPEFTLEEWKEWFTDVATLILRKTAPEGASLFFQSDIKHEGEWVDKSYLIQKAAEQEGVKLLWHKIICRSPAGTATLGRPSYSHMLCFSKDLRISFKHGTADVVESVGEKVWERGMGLNACLIAANFILKETNTKLLINPFCGHGSMLAAANHVGLRAIGIERSPKRAEKARTLQISGDGKSWIP